MRSWRRFEARFTLPNGKEGTVTGGLSSNDVSEITNLLQVNSLTAISIEMLEFQRSKCMAYGMPIEGEVKTFRLFE